MHVDEITHFTRALNAVVYFFLTTSDPVAFREYIATYFNLKLLDGIADEKKTRLMESLARGKENVRVIVPTGMTCRTCAHSVDCYRVEAMPCEIPNTWVCDNYLSR